MSSDTARYLAKLAARANGTTEVVVTPPSPPGGFSDTAEGRYAAKLAARAAKKAAVAQRAAPEEKPPEDAPQAQETVPETERGGQNRNDRHKHHKRR